MTWKKSLLVLCKILRRFGNTLTADDKYYLLNRHNLREPIQILVSQKEKSVFFSIFLCISEIYIKFSTFSKKRWPSYKMYFGKYGLRKKWLDKFLKTHVSEDPSTSNMVNVAKQIYNLDDSTTTIFIYHWERDSVGKTVIYCYAKL